jgi:hypothetical protein
LSASFVLEVEIWRARKDLNSGAPLLGAASATIAEEAHYEQEQVDGN